MHDGRISAAGGLDVPPDLIVDGPVEQQLCSSPIARLKLAALREFHHSGFTLGHRVELDDPAG
jgi:hypothetical protein